MSKGGRGGGRREGESRKVSRATSRTLKCSGVWAPFLTYALTHPCRTLDFDTIMGAIGTNAPPRCKDVVMQFMRPKDAPGPTSLIVIDRFLEFFEVPLDHVFRKN